MLLVHRSERADPLVAELGALLAAPAADPFRAEIVAVPSRGVERWLAQRLSHVLGAGPDAGDGVCANVLFPPSGTLVDDALASADDTYAAAVEQWSAERAVWPLLELVDAEAPPELAAYLAPDDARRYPVAAKLARYYAAYGRSRPEMIEAWHAGRDEQGDGTPLPRDLVWQAVLWRRLRERIGHPSPAEALGAACAAVPAADLPERFSIFGLTRLSPARARALRAIAATRDVHLWLSHPSPALWAAVHGPPGRRADARTTLRNPLLASLSRDIRELQQVLGDVDSVHHPVAERPATLLGRVQDDLAQDRPPQPTARADGSLTVHACHGPARQVEVVREVILGLLRDDPTLEPRDIVIMCPDVEAFAPLVAASFGMSEDAGGHPAGRLRVRLADRALRQTNPLLRLLAQLLELGGARVTATQVLDLAATTAVRAQFAFTDDDVERLRDWTTRLNARWGLDAGHRAAYGLDKLGQGTWRAALDRLLLGAAMEEADSWVGDVLPFDGVDSADIELAGRFAELLDRLAAAVDVLAGRHAVPEWARLLTELVLQLGASTEPWQAVQLRGELEDVADTAADTQARLSRADIAALLARRLAGRPTRASFRTGTLTVCTLVPMRSVPHRVVCLLGMDDGAFPRNALRDGDDVLLRDPRTGERDARSEDRQLFLDALCAAQEHLVIAYTGADPRSGAEVPPCVPLGELLDAVAATTGDREAVVVRHPLQPFDARNFDPPRSFDPVALAGARAAAGQRVAPPRLVDGELAPLPGGDVALEELVRFVQHPVRAFLRQRLELQTYESDDDPSDALPVELDNLQLWAVGDRVLRTRLAGTSRTTANDLEIRRGELPPGPLGARLLRRVDDDVEAVLDACADERAVPAVRVDVDAFLPGGRRVVGTVGGVRGRTVLAVTYSRLGARQRVTAWANHLALVATTDDASLRSVTVGRGRGGSAKSVIAGVSPDDARKHLAALVTMRDHGLRGPLPLATMTGHAYAAARADNRDPQYATLRATSMWEGGNFPEGAEREHVLAFGGVVPFTTLAARPGGSEPTFFGDLAHWMWLPLLRAERLESG